MTSSYVARKMMSSPKKKLKTYLSYFQVLIQVGQCLRNKMRAYSDAITTCD